MPMLQQMHQLEESGRRFAKTKLSELPELGNVCNCVFAEQEVQHESSPSYAAVGGDGTFLLDSGLSKVSVMELVHNGFLYPRETKAVSQLQQDHQGMPF